GLPPEIIPQAATYLNIYMIGLIFLFLFNSLSAILRGVGDSKTPLIFLAVSAVLNVALDLLFVVVFGFGIEGAAWATVISQGFAVTFAFIYTARHNEIVSTNLMKLRFDTAIFLRSLKLGIPAGMQQLFVSIGMLAIMSFVNGFGTDTIAGYAAASRIEAFVFVIPLNLSIAVTNFTAQNYGAGLKDRVRLGVRAALKFSLVASFVILIVLSALSLPLMKMFSPEVSVINVGTTYLYVLGVTFPLFAVMFCYMGALRGMGNTIVPMFITLFSLWIVRVPLAGVLSDCWGEIGIWLSGSASWALGAIVAYIFYRREYRKELSEPIHAIEVVEDIESIV
ncbi:MAG: MATE family efflux transporter, partial [Rikenellaceae bacterium]